MGRRPLYEIPADLSPKEKAKYRNMLKARRFRLRRKQLIKKLQVELNDFRLVLGMARIDGVTGQELAPLELPLDSLVKVAKSLMEAEVASDPTAIASIFRQAQRVLIQHGMDFGTLLLGKAMVAQSNADEEGED
jgi:hypothetical protein